MPDVPNIPLELREAGGVHLAPPPVDKITHTNSLIRDAVAAVGKGRSGSLTVWISTTQGVNAAFVQKAGEHVSIVAYAGKTWGDPIEAGVSTMIEW